MTDLWGETMYRESAVAWLRGEDAWQWSAFKFSVAKNTQELTENGTMDGLWQLQFVNYPPKAQMYREAGSWMHVMQYAGKTAATARGLFVTVHAIAEGRIDDDVADLNAASLNDIATADSWSDFDYHGIDLVWDTPLGDGLREMDGLARTGKFGDSLPIAGRVMLEGAAYFVHKIEEGHQAMGGGELVLPRPGLSSGNIERWVPDAPVDR